MSPRKFNGTAVVEWYNVTNTFDYEVVWSRSFRHLLDAGYVWVGVSAQATGVHSGRGLKAWNPNRYGTIDLTDGGTVTEDALSYDVFSQAAQALRHPRGANPLRGLKVRTLIATGQSQSASRLTTYANSVHPIAPIFDAIAIVDGGVALRTDLTTKVFKTASEYDVLANQAARRQPTRPAAANRDAYQIIKGGIRLAAVAVPTERNTGWNTGLTPDRDSACAQGGTWIPFDDNTLRELYPTHAQYVQAVRQTTAQNVRDGYLTRADADATIRAAANSSIPG